MTRPSGKFVLRLEPDLHQRLKDEAQTHRSSLNQWIVRRLTRAPVVAKDRVAEVLQLVFGEDLEGVIAFGSFTRGEMTEASDVDLLIVMKEARKIDRALYSQWDREVAVQMDKRCSPQFSHLPQTPSSLWLEVALEGEILVDLNGRVRSALQSIRRKIAEGQFIRRISHGHPYWIQQEKE